MSSAIGRIIVETNPDEHLNPFVTIYDKDGKGTQQKYEDWISSSHHNAQLMKSLDKAASDYFLKENQKNQPCTVKPENKEKSIAIPFKVFSNGDIVQTCFDPKTNQSYFMRWISTEQRAEKVLEIIDPDTREKLIPLHDKSLTCGQLILPSGVEEYGTMDALIKEIRAFADEWVELPPEMRGYYVISILQTWLYEKCPALPINDFRADHGAGKTRALAVALFLSFEGLRASGGITCSLAARIIDRWKPTLCLNENDMKESDMTNSFTRMLNERTDPMGVHFINTPERNEGWEPTPYKVFGPTFTTTRQPYSDNALESRCVHFRMTETERDDILLNLPDSFKDRSAILRNKLLLFRFRNYAQMENDFHLKVQRIRKRTLQVMQPMLSLVKSIEPAIFSEIVEMLQEMDQDSNEANYECNIGHIIRAYYKLECGDEFNEPKLTPSSNQIRLTMKEMFGDELPSETVGKILSGLNVKQNRGQKRGWSLGNGKKREKLLIQYCPEYLSLDATTVATERSTVESYDFPTEPAKNNATPTTVTTVVKIREVGVASKNQPA